MAKAKKAAKKLVLPSKLHKAFHAANSRETAAELVAFMEENNIDVNATLYKTDPAKPFDNLYLFYEVLSGKAGLEEKINYFIRNGVDLSMKGTRGQSPLFVVVRATHLPVMKQLLDAGAEVNYQDVNGNTFLTLLTRYYGDKYDINTDPAINSGFRSKPAEDYDLNLQFIHMLLDYSADPSIKNSYDTSALDWLQHRKDSDDFSKEDERLEQLFLKYKAV